MAGSGKPLRYFLHALLAFTALVVLAVAGWIGFTLYCWLFKMKDPDDVLRARRDAYRREQLHQDGMALIGRVRACFPENLPGWEALPYRNDMAGEYYQLLNPIPLKFDFRRKDGSDDLSVHVVVNPAVGEMPIVPVDPFLPDAARPLEAGPWSIGVLHSAFDWNALVPRYDQRPGYGKGFVAQVFVGDWEVRPADQESFRAQREEARLSAARGLRAEAWDRWQRNPGSAPRRDEDFPVLESFLPQVKDETLNPVWLTPAARVAVARSRPDPAGAVHPRCIAVMAAAKDEATLRWLLARVDFAALKRITEGR